LQADKAEAASCFAPAEAVASAFHVIVAMRAIAAANANGTANLLIDTSWVATHKLIGVKVSDSLNCQEARTEGIDSCRALAPSHVGYRS
jgi:hypothetical protein